MKRSLIFVFTLLTTFFIPILANAQDPGQPDTLYIDCTPQNEFGAPESRVRFDIIAKTDNIGSGYDINGITIPLLIRVSNNAQAKAVLDTTVATTYSGTDIPFFDIKTTFVPSAGGRPDVYPMTLLLGMYEFTETGLLEGTYTLAYLTFNVEDTCTITIDTTSTETLDVLEFTTSNVSSYRPRWRKGICQVTLYQNQSGPVCSFPDSIPALSGTKVSFQVTALDPDTVGCYLISECSFDILENPASETSATLTGPCSGKSTSMEFNWQTSVNDTGTFHVILSFRDTCQEIGSCTTKVKLFPDNCISAKIGEVYGSPGSKVLLPVEILTPSAEIGSFVFCVQYYPAILTFISLERGQFFDVRDSTTGVYLWHYLRWWTQPSTVMHKFQLCVVGIGKLFYQYPGTCLPQGGKGVLYLVFRLANNEMYRCLSTPVLWETLDTNCNFNFFSDCSGNINFFFNDTLYYNPEVCAPPWYYPPSLDCAKAINGRITFKCDSQWLRGDINRNGFTYEAGDAYLLINYFIFGSVVFDSNPYISNLQTFATDINLDGIPLTLSDLVWLQRILSGDDIPIPYWAQPPISPPYQNSIGVLYNGRNIEATTPVDLGAMWLVFRGEATTVNVLLSGLEVKWAVHDGQTKVLLYSFNRGGKIPAGSSQLLKISGDVELVKVEAAEYMGTPVNVQSGNFITIPRTFSLSQNYPNPFNNSTTIKFALPKEGKVSLKIYNVVGQLVREFSEFYDAGFHSISWDGTNTKGEKVSSGVYLYKLETENFAEVKKMTLIK